MTPEELAEKYTWNVGSHDWTTVDRERLNKSVATAIREAVEEEREACAKVADDFRYEAGQEDGYGAACYTTAAGSIRDRIRARSGRQTVTAQGRFEPNPNKKLFAISYTCAHGRFAKVEADSIAELTFPRDCDCDQ